MKLRKIKIEDFRALDNFEWDFTDDFGEAHPLVIVVGPNGSGKSTILDAVWFGLMSIVGYKIQRIGFRHEKQYVVRKGANYAKVEYEIEVSDEEYGGIQNWKDQLINREAIGNYKFPEFKIAQVEWTYPSQPNYQNNYYDYGGYRFKNGYDWALLQGHTYYRKLDSINAESPVGREFRGGVYLFEQERQFGDDAVIQPPENRVDDNRIDHSDRPFELRTELIRLGLRSDKGNDPRYSQIRDSYNYVCAPNTMRDVIVEGEEWNIEFRTEHGAAYTFDGLSSGERSILYFLTRYAIMQIRNAIVLIDELEMHLHPTWQRRLYESLRRFDDNNQFIVTTHSPTVEQIAPDEAIISLGDLDIPDWQLAMSYSDD